MEQLQREKILAYFQAEEKVSKGFLNKKGVTDTEIDELLNEGSIIQVGETTSNPVFPSEPQYTRA